MKIKNIIFDYGGILTGLDRDSCIEAFNKINAGNIAKYVEEARQEDLFYDLEMGNISTENFCNEARKISNCNATDKDICSAWNMLLSGIPDNKISTLKELSKKYNLYLLSNTNKIHWDYSLKKIFPQAGIDINNVFRKVFLSYEMRTMKPSEDIFLKVIDDTSISASETLFIDDSKANCMTAENIGLNVIHSPKGNEWLDAVKYLLR